MYKGFKVIDADAHHDEPPDLYERYVESEYRDQALAAVRSVEGVTNVADYVEVRPKEN